MVGIAIAGVGAALPDKILTNVDLESMMDTKDDWIAERTGIRQRHIGGMTSTLSIEAGRKAIEDAGCDPSEIDLLVLATTTPDQMVPATAHHVQHELGLKCGAFDVNAACSGWTYGVIAGAGMMQLGHIRKMLVVGCDSLSRITDYHARDTGILFGDGAGAAVFETMEGPGNFLGWNLGSDGVARGILYADIGDVLMMEGKEVFRRAVRVMVDSGRQALAMAGLTVDDVDVCIPHQANLRIVEAANSRLGIPMEKTIVNMDRMGNTSAGSIPLALEEAVRLDRLHDGDIVLFCGFGAGMSWASAVFRWGRA